MAAINLSTYGLFWKLDPSKMSSPVPEKYKIAQAIRIDTKIVITSEIGARPVVSFKLGEKLGQGSYGVTYKTDLVINAKEVVVKIIRKTKDYNTKDIITEVISQIIAYSASNGINSSTKYGKIEGPFVPNLYMLAEDQSSYYILMERMHSDFKKYIETDDAADTFRDSIIMICLALKSLYETVKFNHRDFKPDNIMFNKEGGLRIIDFGFCCLNYGGMKISSTYEAPKQLLKHCNVRSRDINALFYYILNYTRFKTLACPIKRVIKALMYAKQGDPLEWKNTYGKYNGRPELENLLPENVIRVFSNLEFEGNNICGEIDPSWASHIISINEGLLTNLKDSEIGALNSGLIKEFLSQKKSVTITQRVLKSSKNSDIKGFCESLLTSISPVYGSNSDPVAPVSTPPARTNKSTSGGKKRGRYTKRKGCLLN